MILHAEGVGINSRGHSPRKSGNPILDPEWVELLKRENPNRRETRISYMTLSGSDLFLTTTGRRETLAHGYSIHPFQG